jgi:signal transduction histidine kinase
MSGLFDQLLNGLTNPVILFGHFTYFLLIVSMLMRRMVWLRSFAVASGVAKIIYRAFFVFDPVSVLWETVFVLVNIGQLLLIWYYERHHRFTDDQRHFVDSMPQSVERRALKRLLAFATVREVAADEVLVREGEVVKDLLYVATGVARIESAGRIIAVCGPGDYLGEMSFLSGEPATATVVASKPMRVLAFDQQRLHTAVASDAAIHRAMEAGLNRNLVGKLVRANSAKVAPLPV